MCGICGIAGSCSGARNITEKMLETLKHRGPDGQQIWSGENVTLGFCRLSIIDLSGGMQPLENEDGKVHLVFNGEIYNYKELRPELEKKGHIFRTRTDSEVILHGYEEYGNAVVDHLRGMYAFAIWDENTKTLTAARDPFGIKPFFYTMVDGAFVFASEIKSILDHPGYHRELNEEALEQYLSFQYSVLEETFFKGIYRLMPGTRLTFKDGKVQTEQFFDPLITPGEKKPDDEVIRSIDDVIGNSVQYHMISDVEVGTFLSGGVDSSLIAARFGGQKAFSVGFAQAGAHYNEMNLARETAEKLELDFHQKNIEKDEFTEAVPTVMYHLDEPSGDASAIALFFVAREAAKYVKVITSGEGADELFGGYTIYLEPDALRYISWLPKGVRRALGSLAEHLPYGMKGRGYLIRGSMDVEERFIGNANIFTKEEREALLRRPGQAVSPQELLKEDYRKVSGMHGGDKMQYIDLVRWLPGDILQKADRMSMAHSLELRVPFLDREVFRVAETLATRDKFRNHQTKYLFREAAAKYLPKLTADREKLGFPVPIRVWMREDRDFIEMLRSAFSSEAAERYFHTEELQKLLDDHISGKRDYSRKIWTVYAFLAWYRVFFENTGAVDKAAENGYSKHTAQPGR